MRILIAEDDRQLLASISRGLREAGHEVEQAASGTTALATARGGEFDAIILDILLPGRDGLSVCRELRAAGDRVPILMLTALDAVEQRIAGLDAGADDYLTKPFDFGELLARLRAIVRRTADVVPTSIVVGDLTIDTARRVVTRGEREIDLTAKEFAFLLHLARNVGRVVTRAELMTHVWDDTRTSYTNVIDVYASRLRRKLDDGERVALFSTLRGVGFRLDQPQDDDAPSRARRRSTTTRRE
jgi:two-component system copper resistance phosphate regulon response regulator CusR